jgi:hypothetical protein
MNTMDAVDFHPIGEADERMWRLPRRYADNELFESNLRWLWLMG